VLTFGGYPWWQTRKLLRQIRARMKEQPQFRSQSDGEVIEGEVAPAERTRR
jgi:hypothetical protein